MDTLGEITSEHRGPRTGLTNLAVGPDGAPWFTTAGTIGPMAIGRVTTGGELSNFYSLFCGLGPPVQCVDMTDPSRAPALPPGPRSTRGFGGVTVGPDGAVWFTMLDANRIGRITMEGVAAEYPIPTPASDPGGIVAGADGALWFLELNANRVGRITTDGEITEYPIPTAESGPLSIATGPDGAIWFTEGKAGQIGRLTPAGDFTEYALPTPSVPYGITVGPDGALWFLRGTLSEGSFFAVVSATGIARVTIDGIITEFPFPAGD